jgi:hypothetical protein
VQTSRQKIVSHGLTLVSFGEGALADANRDQLQTGLPVNRSDAWRISQHILQVLDTFDSLAPHAERAWPASPAGCADLVRDFRVLYTWASMYADAKAEWFGAPKKPEW